MITDINIDMIIEKNKNMKILEKNGKIKLVYLHKIIKKTVQRKNKAGTINTFYSAYLPAEIVDYFNVKENTIFFYSKDDEVRITTNRPTVEHQEIKVQSSNQFSIPKSYLKPEEFEMVKLVLDFGRVDDYKSGLGVLIIELI